MSVTLHTTLGPLKVELACETAPRLCESWLALAAGGVYTGTTFHRNLAGFIVQGGDPTGTGRGGESVHGGTLPDEPSGLSHARRGTLSAANAGTPDSNGAQFFFAYGPQPSLDGKFVVIGQLVGDASFATLDAMEAAPVAGKRARPVTPIEVTGVVVHANPFAVA